ncbi:Hypothetical protein ZAZAV_10 [Cedratvirus Zaza IHUMI]|uniref:Nucleotidyltransferase n=1 Tax=Cedratvirus Zaza IHUMI TaxID=2126979 RepID=A0A2R8FD00_9VIRU|nr:Hypothetical protein ZAZAV_10 [Cedratvirus Zaza IHUMI]
MQKIQELVFSYGGVLAGSFVRDVVIRGEKHVQTRDLDVLLTFTGALELLNEFTEGVTFLSYSEEERFLHYIVKIEEVLLDVFAGSDEEHVYLCSPDADVNCLCYDGQGFFLWYPILGERYGVGMDEHDVIERALKKQATMLVHEWKEEEKNGIMKERKDKLVRLGWLLL